MKSLGFSVTHSHAFNIYTFKTNNELTSCFTPLSHNPKHIIRSSLNNSTQYHTYTAVSHLAAHISRCHIITLLHLITSFVAVYILTLYSIIITFIFTLIYLHDILLYYYYCTAIINIIAIISLLYYNIILLFFIYFYGSNYTILYYYVILKF